MLNCRSNGPKKNLLPHQRSRSTFNTWLDVPTETLELISNPLVAENQVIFERRLRSVHGWLIFNLRQVRNILSKEGVLKNSTILNSQNKFVRGWQIIRLKISLLRIVKPLISTRCLNYQDWGYTRILEYHRILIKGWVGIGRKGRNYRDKNGIVHLT